jgi:hypothetical protein
MLSCGNVRDKAASVPDLTVNSKLLGANNSKHVVVVAACDPLAKADPPDPVEAIDSIIHTLPPASL